MPFTVLGGFLGAGKTTLVNHILRNARGRYAVLVNDFGAINVDVALIVAHEGETLRLANGCICCSLGDDFAASIARLLDGEAQFDHIFVEASGVADPQAIADIALIDPQLALNAVVVVADAERIAMQIVDRRIGDTLMRQLRAADIVLLNKCDLADGDTCEAAMQAMRVVDPHLRIVQTVAADVPIELIDNADISTKPLFHAEPASHEMQFRRVLYRSQAHFDAARLQIILDAMPLDLLRLKGFCRLSGEAKPNVLQWAGGRWSLASFANAPDDPAIELVGIGTATLDPTAVETCLNAALAY